MKVSKSKLNIGIGVMTGLLAGFVLGAAFLDNPGGMATGSKAGGNVSRLSRTHLGNGTSATDNATAGNASADSQLPLQSGLLESDSISLTATDAQGQNWTITIRK